MGELVHKYVLFKAEFDESATFHKEIGNTEAPLEGYFYRFPSSNKVYVYEKQRDNEEVSVHVLTTPKESEERRLPNSKNGDGVFNWSDILKSGLLLRNF